MSVEDIVREWPALETKDVYESLAYAAASL
jgi:uncharacterized protein (DUF433 family)